MPTSPKPKPAQHGSRIVIASAPAAATQPTPNEQLRALQMSMDTRQ
jgi:hypothetical protein